ncbi:IS66 family transposase [Enterococcus cecorum]|uniref:Transposase IS66 C-terminal domain-containing protein n=1 Tax=Enterococcus cecorum DSM 20682 = ATCC 43198 TaxID=1121864 RepID=S1RJ81_9ENTE|nr:hypothetical protein I567_01911 [Enterococcus cecorum DSM 20682 = ATCC 43198]ESK62680.1 hypothetical protein OMO_00329 [Enterococcus cecorum DSM 20682 = ATCC 43198]CAI3368644.1 hypothetical protein CIRMBP1318_00632 [Enterococcus cecorum DSM 20682 = ATCC 43198]SQE54848.1 IS66 family transposase [Enterococcus cecorum]STP85099.1 IS66 family transposase [Enterococcus cecorum]
MRYTSLLGAYPRYGYRRNSTYGSSSELSFGNANSKSGSVAERAIKGLVMGRKNWLFSQSVEVAKSNASILSLLETAKRNDIDSEKYLTYLLEKLPNEESFAKKAVLEAYLPKSETVQANCK